jgi:hypothetical protein
MAFLPATCNASQYPAMIRPPGKTSAMNYHADDSKISISDLRLRIEGTDLIPSREELKNGLGKNLAALKSQGLHSLKDLRRGLKKPSQLQELSKSTGIAASYLNLLRREIEGYFPQPVKLVDFKWLTKGEVASLNKADVTNSQNLFEKSRTKGDLATLMRATQLDSSALNFVIQACDLMRIQWVSPGFARMLIAAGYKSARKVAAADPKNLDDALQKANAKHEYFKGKIGLRDVMRVVKAAGYV